MRELISLCKGIVTKRKLILDLSKADFRKRFVGSYFGVVWMFIQPMVTIAIYAFIFGEYGMKNAPPVWTWKSSSATEGKGLCPPVEKNGWPVITA